MTTSLTSSKTGIEMKKRDWQKPQQIKKRMIWHKHNHADHMTVNNSGFRTGFWLWGNLSDIHVISKLIMTIQDLYSSPEKCSSEPDDINSLFLSFSKSKSFIAKICGTLLGWILCVCETLIIKLYYRCKQCLCNSVIDLHHKSSV